MSIQQQSKVWEQSETSGHTRVVHLRLADYASPDGTDIFPSLHTIAKECRASVSTVQRSINELKDLGYLVQIASGGKFGEKTRTNHYELRWPESTPKKAKDSEPEIQTTSPKSSSELIKAKNNSSENKNGGRKVLSSERRAVVMSIIKDYDEDYKTRTGRKPSIRQFWKMYYHMDEMLDCGYSPTELVLILKQAGAGAAQKVIVERVAADLERDGKLSLAPALVVGPNHIQAVETAKEVIDTSKVKPAQGQSKIVEVIEEYLDSGGTAKDVLEAKDHVAIWHEKALRVGISKSKPAFESMTEKSKTALEEFVAKASSSALIKTNYDVIDVKEKIQGELT